MDDAGEDNGGGAVEEDNPFSANKELTEEMEDDMEERVPEGKESRMSFKVDPNRKLHELTDGFIKSCFYGKIMEITTSASSDSKMEEESEFFQLLLEVGENKNKLYESWDENFRFSVLDELTGDILKQKQKWVTELPSILTFRLLRVGYDPEN